MRRAALRILSVVALVTAGLAPAGCGTAETEFAMGDWIELGPFTFTVERASDRLQPATSGRPRVRVVSVHLRVDSDRSAAAKIKFDDFLNDMVDRGMVAFPAAKLVDREGHEFDGLVRRVSGRTRWRIDFDLLVPRLGMRSSESFVDLRAADLRLHIRNLDHRSGQPRVAVVQLR